MGFTDSFKKVIGLTEISEDEIVTEEELREEKKKIEREAKVERESGFTPSYSFNSSRNQSVKEEPVNAISQSIKSTEKRFSVTGSNSLKLIVIEPSSFDESQKLVDNLKQKKPVIINLEKLETDTARKIFDFLNGATYALDGKVQKIANNIFVFAPKNVSVAAQQTQGFSTDSDNQNRWR